MISWKKSFYTFAVAIIVLLTTATSYAKSFTFSTNSKEAKGYIVQALRQVDSFQLPAKVQELAKKSVEADPNFAFAHYLVGATTFPPAEGRKHIDRALELAKEASDAERRYLEAISLNLSQKPNDAVKILVELESEYPQERLVKMMLGQIYFNQGKIDEAKPLFEKAVKLDPTTPRAYSFLGNIYLLKENYIKARLMYQASLKRRLKETAPFAPNYGLAYTYIYQGNLASALKTLENYKNEYIRTGGFPDLPAVFIWNSIARLMLENGRPEDAIKAYEKGYETVPGSTMEEQEKTIWLGRLHHGKGRALSKMGKSAEAWKEAEQIQKMIEENGERGKQFTPSYHYIAGYLKLQDGDYKAAIEHLQQANQNDLFHKFLLATAYEKSGEIEKAQKIYREIVDSKQVNLERALTYQEAKKKLKS
ncbi:MAG: tetratricopeptide repeat protein [Blastocatellia bacterium]|nr:tetratricopeptide repeat protein [Blastocatellia bacterium]